MKVVLACGYFDWFSGYQETGLASALSQVSDTHVIAGDRVNPIFSESHLAPRGIQRRYPTGTSQEHGVTVTRVRTLERRAMLYASDYRQRIHELDPDLIIQVMPGQLLPALATTAAPASPHVALYGDNSAMWANLNGHKQRLKWVVFSQTKGRLYSWVNSTSVKSFGYTPETVSRLSPFDSGNSMEVLPLAFQRPTYFYDQILRSEAREKYGLLQHETAVLVAGKLQPQKRIDLVASAVSRVLARGQPMKLIVAGGSSDAKAKSILDPIRSLPHIRENLIETGFLSQVELNMVFNASDIGFWPTMPAITIQQAMGTGLPVAIHRNEIVGHLLREGTGWFLEGGKDLEAQIFEVLMERAATTIDRKDFASKNLWLSSDEIARSLLRFGRGAN